jgi:hypothetical protein
MILQWIGVALLAGSWLLGMDYYMPGSTIGWVAAVVLGTMFLCAQPIRTLLKGTQGDGLGETLPGSSPHPGPLRAPTEGWSGEGTIYLSVLLLLPVAWFAPWPFRMAPLLVILGLIAERFVRSLGRGIMTAGLVLFAQIPCLEIYAWWTARAHDLPRPLPEMLAGLARLLGVDAAAHVSADDSSVVMHTYRQIHRLAAAWDLLLDPASLCFFIGGLALLGLSVWRMAPAAGRWRAWLGGAGRLALVMLAWLPIRSAALMAVYVHRVLRCDYAWPPLATNHFFSPWILLLMLAGPALLAWRFVRLKTGPIHMEREEGKPVPIGAPRQTWPIAAAIVLVVVGMAMLALGAYWDPIGERKGGRVMVVERHSAWEPTLRIYNTKFYGEDPSYNYRLLYDLCAQYYDMSRVIMPEDLAGDYDPAIVKDLREKHEFREITDQTLENCDVLIIKTPCSKKMTEDEEDRIRQSSMDNNADDKQSIRNQLSARYSREEIQAVHRFVERGGGLLLMGDHTNVFNTSTVMNDIVRPMGFTFRNDLLFGLGELPYEEHFEKSTVPHPSIENLPPLDFAVSCSIDPGWSWGRAAIMGTGLFSMGPEYHHSNYHPYPQYVPEMRYGPFIQVWAMRYGKGRVLAFTDSTQFSNFCLFQPGKSELAIGMIEWLNHAGSGDPGPWLLVLGCAPLLGGLWLARGRGGMCLLLLAAGACSWSATSAGIAAVQRLQIPMPQRLPQATPKVEVVIDRTLSQVPLIRGAFYTVSGPELDKSFGLLEQWIPRLCTPDLYYYTTRRAGEAAFAGDALVIVYPDRPVTTEYRQRLEQYVANGGKVLVIDSPSNVGSTANSLLYPFDLSFLRDQPWEGFLTLDGRWPWLSVDEGHEVSGGKPLAYFGERPVAAVASYGNKGGKVLAVGFGSIWRDPKMGGEPIWMVQPDADQQAIYEVLYSLVRLLVEDKPIVAPTAAEVPEPKADIRESELIEPK